MARFTYTIPLFTGALLLTACPDDQPGQNTSGDTNGTTGGSGVTNTSGMGSGMNENTSSADTMADSTGATTMEPECVVDEDCPQDGIPQACLGGLCFDDPLACGGAPVGGNYANCIEGGMPSDGPCAEGVCVGGDENSAVCVVSNCEEDCQCPAGPDSGNAEVSCEDVTQDRINDCILSCSGGATCPDSMYCFGGFICLHSAAPIPPYGPCEDVDAACEDGHCVEVGAGAWCGESCQGADDCSAPPSGTAVPACDDVDNDRLSECYLDCSGDATCPDGMECSPESICVFAEPVAVLPPYGDCVDNPASTCQPNEDTCVTVTNNATTADAAFCSQSGCADAGGCPAGDSGDAPAACGDLDGNGNACYLDCSGGQTCPFGMQCINDTACMWPDQGLVLNENFELQAFRPGWTRIDVDGNTPNMNVSYVDDAWVITDQLQNGQNFAAYSVSWYEPVAQADDWMISPQITLGAASTMFWIARAPDADFADGYEVRISTAGPIVEDFMANEPVFTIAAEAAQFTSHNVDLAAAGYMNQDVYIAFRNNSNDRFLLLVDNIRVTQ